MKHLRAKYFEAVMAWDRKHRLIGKTPLRQLYTESLTAARRFSSSASAVIVDIGAGSGILGVAWLLGSRHRRVVFVEPDLKKASFLRFFFSVHFSSRARVLDLPIENVSRETLIKQFASPESLDFIFVARAFSSEHSLAKTIEATWLAKEDIFTFESMGNAEYSLRKLKI